MIIHSKFQDYYDSALGFGVDETIHYARKEEEFFSNEIDMCDENVYERIQRYVRSSMRWEYNNLMDGRSTRTGILNPRIRHGVIVIGRNVFVGVLFINPNPTNPVTYFCNTFEDLKNACEKSGMKYNPEFETHKFHGFLFGKARTNRETFERRIENTQKYLEEHFSDIEDLMVKLNTPILVFTEGDHDNRFHVVKDAFLKPYGIVSKLDPFQTFQEISMFMGNTLCNNEPDMVEISDKHKRDGKGFDEISFKNRGGKKPRRKNK